MAAVAGPTTPQRPLPGAYFATPAQAPTIFAANAASLRQNPQQQPADSGSNTNNAPQSVEPIDLASRKINETLIQEERFPDLESYITQGISHEYELPSSPAWMPFQKLKQYDIPPKLLDQTNHAGLNMLMGIFPALGHAWIALDNSLYLWDYTLPNPEIIGYEENPHAIKDITLVAPKEGVFVKDIEHLIVVTTNVDMTLLGVAAQTTSSGAKTVALYNTKMSIQVRGLSVSHVVGTRIGRIFFVSKQSEDIYEFQYQQDEGWFSSRTARICHTKTQFAFLQENVNAVTHYFANQQSRTTIEHIAIDDSRMLMYTVSSRNEISIWGLRHDVVLLVKRPWITLLENAGMFTPSNEALQKGGVVSISIIPVTEASRVALVVTTNTGFRLYMSAANVQGQQATAANVTNLQVMHIRFPPGDPHASGQAASQAGQNSYGSANNNAELSSRVLWDTTHGYRLPPGNFIAITQDNNRPGRIRALCSAPDAARLKLPDDPTPFNSRFSELGMFIDLPGGFQQLMDTKPAGHGATNGPLGFGNELATQFDEPSSEIVIVTSAAIQTIRRRRLVDIFAAMMRYSSSNEEGLEGDIKRFRNRYGLEETAATAFAVACGQGIDVTSDSRLTSITDPEVREGARKVIMEHGGEPTYNANALSNNNTPAIDYVRPSPRCYGLALYISRLVRSIWRRPILREIAIPGQAPTLSSTIDMKKLRDIQAALNKLLEFLDSNKTFIRGLQGPQAGGRNASRQDEIANQGESKHMDSLMKLIPRITEGISFVIVLFDNRIEDILTGVGEESRKQARGLTFNGLFVSAEGRDLAKELVKAIVNLNIANGSNVDTVAEALRRRCGSFCSADDVVIFKAQEQVKRATEAGSQTETGRALLNESQRLFQKVAGSLGNEHLTWAVNQYVQMEFYAGAIQLCLVVAGEKDRAKRALAWLKEGMPDGDPRRTAFEDRERVYHLIFMTIEALDKQTQNAPETMDGQYTVAAKRRNEAYDVVHASEDAVFQTCLFDWYVSQGQADRLLDIDTHFVVDYLKRRSQEDRAHADLLWRYHAHHNDYLQAAAVQLDLARGFFELSLEERIEYLSRARTNASTRQTALMDSRQSKQQLLREISDLLDVANIQDDLLQRMKAEPRLTGERRDEVLRSLNGPVLPLDELFNQYADQASYHDICILIYQVADHRNPADIKATWQNLIDQTDDQSQALYGKQALSWESVGEKVRELGRRLNVSDATFTIQILLPMLERYAMMPHDHKPPSTWAVDLFLDLDIPHETLLPVMEQMYYGNEHPFVGSKRKILAGQMVYLLRSWFEQSERRGERNAFGSEENASLVIDCAASLLKAGELDAAARREAEQLVSSVQRAMR
ncbi:hypothetical protein LTR37_021025 [Vermiconidia calcicola]|uniref:Uncharacterized protein n=1 Tax=Vermiconidia calcicola TaxID=1690605 RepID=A0ACC3MAT8_9PEZI|nr:hypothetical protein LTR37_021025 [Vermiconidia calcicola]